MKLEKLLPEVYYKESRDFAFIARLIEIYINYMKSAADNVDFKMNKSTLNSYILQLVANNLGFKLKHNYDNKDLMYLCTTLMHLYRKKGSVQAIVDAIQLLVNSQKIDEKISRDNVTINNNGELEIRIPNALMDVTLLEDVFDYILPAGMTYTFIRVYTAKESDKLVSFSYEKDDVDNKALSKLDAHGLYEIQSTNDKLNNNGKSKYLGNIGSSVVFNNATEPTNTKTNSTEESTEEEKKEN